MKPVGFMVSVPLRTEDVVTSPQIFSASDRRPKGLPASQQDEWSLLYCAHQTLSLHTGFPWAGDLARKGLAANHRDE